jgi:hypothetical protein
MLEWLGWCMTAMNLWAYLSGTGAGKYQDFKPFDLVEVYKMIGILFTNGLTPKPQSDHWFRSQEEEPLFGSTMIRNALNQKNPAMGKTIKVGWHWKHFRHYFTMQDYHKVPWEQQKKIRLRLIDEPNKQAKDMWVPGIFVTIDEQTIGFQGQSGLKLQISYTNRMGMASNAMLYVIQDTPSLFISAMGCHLILMRSIKISTSLQQHEE